MNVISDIITDIIIRTEPETRNQKCPTIVVKKAQVASDDDSSLPKLRIVIPNEPIQVAITAD
jgi:hypothetical protein